MDTKWIYMMFALCSLTGIAMAGMATADIYPGYFSNIETGSSFFGPQVSAATSANSRFVSATATTPISLGYSVISRG